MNDHTLIIPRTDMKVPKEHTVQLSGMASVNE
jgi:hypothetical protein